MPNSSEYVHFEGGMRRHSSEGKTNYSLVYDGPMFRRWAEHLSKGASLHGSRNWMKAEGEDAMERALESADRHHYQWRNGDTDEDHAAALFFNVNLYEYTKERVEEQRIRDMEIEYRRLRYG